ncbi:hypothetical protein ACFQO1_02215 [Jejudonia soesokkakensis]|uniref:Beta-lactamase-inhibitor-like PepSY-like domain-containing protein n=1 Tax=Jejudonia soesokkakensis TaxID=1323432 RepID=A0ABW2MS04_9FLAO
MKSIFKLLVVSLGLFVFVSCKFEDESVAVIEKTSVIPKNQGPHAILFENFVNERPFVPSQHFDEMEQKGATFYYDDKQISFVALKKLIEVNALTHIKTTGSTGTKPSVYISVYPRNNANPETNYGVKTDPAAELTPYKNKEVAYYIGEKMATLEEVKSVLRNSEFPRQLLTVQIDDQPLRIIVSNGC